MSSAFAERDNRIRRNFVPGLLRPIRPVNYHKLDLGIYSKAKVHADVAGAQVTGIRVHAAKELASSLLEFDACANPEQILSRLFQAYLQPVVAIVLTGFVQQKAYRPVVVGHHDIDVAVVVDIAERRSTAYLGTRKRRTCLASGLAKPSSLFVVEQLVGLIERKHSAAQRFQTHNGSIGDEEIEESIVVVVEPLCAESGVGESRLPEAEFRRGVVEFSLAIVAIENAGFLGKVGYQQVFYAAVADVPEGDAHAPLRDTFAVVCGAGFQTCLLERPILLVEPKVVGGGVVGNIDVHSAVAIEIGTDNTQTGAGKGSDARFFGDVDELAVAQIVEQPR